MTGVPGQLNGWFEKLLGLFFPHYDIVNGGELYLRRFMVRKSATKGNIFVHHIYKSDDDRLPHTHPWAFDSFILAGGYMDHAYPHVWRSPSPTRATVEKFPYNKWSVSRSIRPRVTEAKVGRLYRRPSSHCHMLKLHPGKTAWTLVRTTGQLQPWGFMDVNEWTYWRVYLNDWTSDPG